MFEIAAVRCEQLHQECMRLPYAKQDLVKKKIKFNLTSDLLIESRLLASMVFTDGALGLLHANKRYHMRKIARLTDTVAGSLHKELARLADAGLFLKETVGNQVLCGANRDCPIFEKLTNTAEDEPG